ncbi:MAG: hypothetical protein A2600_04170 [Candidatus Lambdaproteobacteria bacterium RIFOXYD1_FULL_56_27]|uniref:Co-chaperone DjlA N-terminal domain-containing protein n=1 Tax=Candidatus Lambdaproteobacteria bacterium RIFOXYD2_FULL_56_26 TaxID=1817773 RepID=A0A1F6H3K4_9PROT|nr:MAG: hypothetical protein A2426_01970 [Candidatus Lambdaproteobacteria bacterium RIFOXYC1_FULL_56_13]OGH04953.1 MAG: hypothetical protein A2557_08235 [Candidatus Lambdaproteobacteria bacterium RIFOXYD2_FULL_56_26]OGH09418.1 MAG: hypothetical protein A2600_04170 [Candidatus Lambdaproteobacteria bacterium RIFOXYD1_FULL_56_27]
MPCQGEKAFCTLKASQPLPHPNMHVPVAEFTPEQRLWYGKLIATAVKVDGVISPDEIDFLILTFHFLDVAQKQEVQEILRAKGDSPPLPEVPKGFSKTALALILTHVVVVMTADSSLSVKEKLFIEEVAGRVRLSEFTTKGIMEWADRVYEMEKERRMIISRSQ